jgi:hypothetical protein
VRVEVTMSLPSPKIIITASSAAGEQRIAEQVAPYVVQAINDTFGELIRVVAQKEEAARAQEPRR